MNLKESTQHILLYENCHFTLGASRSLLADNQRYDMYFFDNEIFHIFAKKSRQTCIRDILLEYNDEEQKIISEYFQFMIDNELAFTCCENELEFFPEMIRNFETPEIISNCIIDFNNEPKDLTHYKKTIEDLDILGCENIEIRDFFGLSFSFLEEFLALFNETILHRIELVSKCIGSVEEYQNFLIKHARINSLLVHSCENLILENSSEIKSDQIIQFSNDQIIDNSHCGIVSPNYFNLDLRHTNESLNYNTCLNKKISIDVNGEIKNCPSLSTSYGNIETHSLVEIANDPKFQKLWQISKSKIKECKMCEFRNICTDCRAFHVDDHSIEKPSKCSYNPYSMVWES